eukprot:scaffold302_cov247-Pinguiococcus_pyrenoidosus.AAC.12
MVYPPRKVGHLIHARPLLLARVANATPSLAATAMRHGSGRAASSSPEKPRWWTAFLDSV